MLEKGIVEIYKNGKMISQTENHLLIDGEDMLAKFIAKSFANKYDANEGATQAGYFDFMALGTGFLSPAEGGLNVLVLPNKPIGISDEAVDIYDGCNVRIHSGQNAGVVGVVAENGYNPSNADYGNLPTITLVDNLDYVVASGVQFTIDPVVKERSLQGERRADNKGATFLNPTAWRVPVSAEKVTLSVDSNPIGENNEVWFTATINGAQLSGAESILLTEVALVNTITVPASADVKSGLYFARAAILATELAPDEDIVVRWRIRLGAQRELSI